MRPSLHLRAAPAGGMPTPDLFAALSRRHPQWAAWGFAYLALAAASCLLMIWDQRTLYDVSVWTKPIKFELSLGVYFLTLAWFAPLLRPGYFASRAGRIMTWTPIVAALLEIVYISYQAARAEPSHFNESTPWHAAAYQLMGLGAITLVSVCLWMGAAIAQQHRRRGLPLGAYGWAVVAGLALTFLLGGGLGGYLGSQGGHWVGAAGSDANGLWLFGWSRSGGDLRVAHFFGIHAMQVIPVMGWLTVRLWGLRGSTTVVLAVVVLYTAGTLATFAQALGGQPVLAAMTTSAAPADPIHR